MRVPLTKGKRAPGMDLSFAQVATRRNKPWKGDEHQVGDNSSSFISNDALSYICIYNLIPSFNILFSDRHSRRSD
jgi:hypothetical protein